MYSFNLRNGQENLFMLIPMLLITDMIFKQTSHCSVWFPFTWFYQVSVMLLATLRNISLYSFSLPPDFCIPTVYLCMQWPNQFYFFFNLARGPIVVKLQHCRLWLAWSSLEICFHAVIIKLFATPQISALKLAQVLLHEHVFDLQHGILS